MCDAAVCGTVSAARDMTMKTGQNKRRTFVESEKAAQGFLKRLIHAHRKDMGLFLGGSVLVCLLCALVTVLLWKHTPLAVASVSVLAVPGLVRLLLPRAIMLALDHKTIRLFKRDRKTYDEWLSLHRSKMTDASVRSACELFAGYRDVYPERHEELLALLKEKLKKPADPAVASVAAGLVFLCNDANDFDALYDARYKHGPAGSMIPDIWLRHLCSGETDKGFSGCAEEFVSYWDEKCRESKNRRETQRKRP
jgi:hypothetical protein